MRKTKFYTIWSNMKSRCNNSNSKNYIYYGGRGIKVCDRWVNSFENFKDDMYESYLNHVDIYGEKNTTIDRIDVNKDYDPVNCRWATIEEQANNKTDTHYVTYDGETMSLAQFAKKYETPNVPANTILTRISRGYELDVAISNIVGYYNGKPVINAITFTNKEV